MLCRGVVGTFALQIAVGHAAQFAVNNRHQRIESFPIPVPPAHQQLELPVLEESCKEAAPSAMGVARCGAKHSCFSADCQFTEKKRLSQLAVTIFATGYRHLAGSCEIDRL